MSTIIVPTDFSPSALSALNYAADMAIRHKASILLFNSYQVPVSMTDTAPIVISVEELQETADKNLAELKASLARITPPELVIETKSELGDTIDELDNLCRQLNPVAVVMGATGHTGAERALFGSTTLAASEVLPSPVICVPRGTEFGKGVQKVLLATGLKEPLDDLTHQSLHSLVRLFEAELHVLDLDKEEISDADDSGTDRIGILREKLGDLAPQFHHAAHDAGAINEFAEKNNFDMVFIIPRKQKLLDILFSKDVSKDVLVSSHIPVVSLPTAETD